MNYLEGFALQTSHNDSRAPTDPAPRPRVQEEKTYPKGFALQTSHNDSRAPTDPAPLLRAEHLPRM
jgi:hypothetical protein